MGSPGFSVRLGGLSEFDRSDAKSLALSMKSLLESRCTREHTEVLKALLAEEAAWRDRGASQHCVEYWTPPVMG